MGSEKGNASNNENKNSMKEQADLVLSSLSSSVERTEEVVSKVRSAFAGCVNLTALVNQCWEIESLLSEIMISLGKTRAIINNLMGESNATSVQQNQAAALSLFQQSQVASPPDIIPKNQATPLCNRAAVLPQSNIPQHNQAARPCNILSVQNQARVPSFNAFRSPLSNAGVPFGSYIHPQKKVAITPSVPQQNQAALTPCSTIGPQYEALLPISPGQQQTFQQSLQQVPNPGINVGSTASEFSTRKGRLEELYAYGQNNELPERLKRLEYPLTKRILDEIIDQDAIIKWDEIAGLEHAKNCVHETVLWPVLNPKIFQGVGSIGKGVLLFGPPGTGKTMIGKAIAGEMKATFFNISASSLPGRCIGEAENLVRTLFAVASHLQPSVIFLDEIDSILFRRSSNTEPEVIRRIKTQLLAEMEGIDSGSEQIIVIGATNRPEDLDEAARTRLSKRLYIPLPSSQARLHIVLNTVKCGRYVLSEQELDLICNLTDDYSGSDMKNLVKEAMMGPIRDAIRDDGKDIRELQPEDLRPVALQDFEKALKVVRPSLSQMELDAYVEWKEKFGTMSL
ncbi:ATPase family AAA domain-containing protein FIGL1-like [Durio zibethinus]|uniref:ATPase family AAA domain-containing protein FIGL1-like n=1 Tax=Durio zibethinus TaxID=66656 RepID=A0A6P5Z3I8_DURZI|nr:ATPase family AAA domain-containing protein FIGL1-like [Durio zibethinus]